MPKWKKNETDFTVSVSKDNRRAFVCRLPKPMVEMMGIGDKVRFRVLENRVEVSRPGD